VTGRPTGWARLVLAANLVGLQRKIAPATRMPPNVTPAVDWPGKTESPTSQSPLIPVPGPRAVHNDVCGKPPTIPAALPVNRAAALPVNRAKVAGLALRWNVRAVGNPGSATVSARSIRSA